MKLSGESYGSVNDSNGCGLMHVAPIWCFYGAFGKPYDTAKEGA